MGLASGDTSVHICVLLPSATLGSAGAQPRGTNPAGSGVSASAGGLQSGAVLGCQRCLTLSTCSSGTTTSPSLGLQSLLTPHRALCPGDFCLLLPLNECLASSVGWLRKISSPPLLREGGHVPFLTFPLLERSLELFLL